MKVTVNNFKKIIEKSLKYYLLESGASSSPAGMTSEIMNAEPMGEYDDPADTPAMRLMPEDDDEDLDEEVTFSSNIGGKGEGGTSKQLGESFQFNNSKELRGFVKRLIETIELDIEKGDIILTGRFKNKRTVVKKIGTDDLGQPIINGMKALTFRIEKKMPKEKWSKKSIEALEFADKVKKE